MSEQLEMGYAMASPGADEANAQTKKQRGGGVAGTGVCWACRSCYRAWAVLPPEQQAAGRPRPTGADAWPQVQPSTVNLCTLASG